MSSYPVYDILLKQSEPPCLLFLLCFKSLNKQERSYCIAQLFNQQPQFYWWLTTGQKLKQVSKRSLSSDFFVNCCFQSREEYYLLSSGSRGDSWW